MYTFPGSQSTASPSITDLNSRGVPYSPPLPAMAQERGLFSKVRDSIRTHLQLRSLLRLPPFLDVVENNPKFALKYVTWNYLARGLTIPERAACFLHHYDRLYAGLPDRLLRQVLHWDIPLHEIHDGVNRFTLSMGRSRPFYKEGEMSLHLKFDGEIFFTLSFTIVPGWVVRANTAEVLLISRLQGTPGCYPDQMKLATKAMHGVRPRTALMFALQGIAKAFSIAEIASVSAVRHSSYAKECEPSLRKAYDDFFLELGLPCNPAGFFLVPVPLEEVPLECISANNRSRARKNRALKEEIRLACAGFFGYLHPSSPAASAPFPGA